MSKHKPSNQPSRLSGQRYSVTAGKESVPLWEKSNLTIREAAILFGIGTNKLRELTDRSPCPFVLHVGTRRLIKREAFQAFLDKREVL